MTTQQERDFYFSLLFGCLCEPALHDITKKILLDNNLWWIVEYYNNIIAIETPEGRERMVHAFTSMIHSEASSS